MGLGSGEVVGAVVTKYETGTVLLLAGSTSAQPATKK